MKVLFVAGIAPIVARLLSPEGLLLGGTDTPWMRGQ
jgi:hypothetical protein